MFGQRPLHVVVPEDMPTARLLVVEDGCGFPHPLVVGKGIQRILIFRREVHGWPLCSALRSARLGEPSGLMDRGNLSVSNARSARQ